MAPAATLVLIRHADIDCTNGHQPLLCGSHDAPLSRVGMEQVEWLRRRLYSGAEAAAAYCSPLRRARQTADAAGETLLARLRILNSLAEIHCGELEGRSINLIRSQFPELWERNEAQDDEEFRWPGGESYRRFRRRVLRAVRAISARHPGERVLVFTHAGVINQVLGSIVGQSPAHWENFRPYNTALTTVAWSGNQGRLLHFDDRNHLRQAA